MPTASRPEISNEWNFVALLGATSGNERFQLVIRAYFDVYGRPCPVTRFKSFLTDGMLANQMENNKIAYMTSLAQRVANDKSLARAMPRAFLKAIQRMQELDA